MSRCFVTVCSAMLRAIRSATSPSAATFELKLFTVLGPDGHTGWGPRVQVPTPWGGPVAPACDGVTVHFLGAMSRET